MSQPRSSTFPIDPQFLARWSPRAFTGEAIPEDTLLSFFEAARWAPSAFNAQPWRFIYGRRDTAAWSPILDNLVEFNRSWAQSASALVVIVSANTFTAPGKTEPAPNNTHAFDTGAAWAMFALQASLAGWHTHGMAGFDRAALAAALGVPADHTIQAVVAVGKIGDKSQLPEGLQAREFPSDRLPLSAVAAQGHFSFKR